jgi:hypothetical protein
LVFDFRHGSEPVNWRVDSYRFCCQAHKLWVCGQPCEPNFKDCFCRKCLCDRALGGNVRRMAYISSQLPEGCERAAQKNCRGYVALPIEHNVFPLTRYPSMSCP